MERTRGAGVTAVLGTTLAAAVTLLAGCGRSLLWPGTDAAAVDAPQIALTCLGESVRCGAIAACVDLRTDNENCGACHNACPAGFACSSATCVATCPAPQALCRPEAGPPTCATIETDPSNCGACDNACPVGFACLSGTCLATCPAPQALCRSEAGAPTCATTATDPDNCGVCANQCKPGYRCSGGACYLSCPASLTTCAVAADGGTVDACIDTANDPANCGACRRACRLAHASAFCRAGACGVAACDPGHVNCDGQSANGCECAAAACAAGVCRKRVFVTSKTYGADLGGLDGADSKCQVQADAAGLGGTYRAWLSDTTGSPSTRFSRSSVPYALVDGTIVANDWTDLTDGSLVAPINKTETGGAPPLDDSGCGGGTAGHPTAWANTWAWGAFKDAREDCDDWSSTTAFSGFTGLTSSTTEWWSVWCQMGCDRHAALYCFEQ